MNLKSLSFILVLLNTCVFANIYKEENNLGFEHDYMSEENFNLRADIFIQESENLGNHKELSVFHIS